MALLQTGLRKFLGGQKSKRTAQGLLPAWQNHLDLVSSQSATLAKVVSTGRHPLRVKAE
jgi:hypothetical protein